jgi:hypothetical protein
MRLKVLVECEVENPMDAALVVEKLGIKLKILSQHHVEGNSYEGGLSDGKANEAGRWWLTDDSKVD